MSIKTAAGREAAASGYAAKAVTAAAYTTAAGSTAGTEPTGGTPAYARKTITWNAGTVDGIYTATVVFDVPAGVSIQSVGLLDSSGTFIDSVAAAYAAQTGQGTLTVDLTYTQS